jgi:hypothetical protein
VHFMGLTCILTAWHGCSNYFRDEDLGTSLSRQSQRCRETGAFQSAADYHRRFALPGTEPSPSSKNHVHPNPNPRLTPDLRAKVRGHNVRGGDRSPARESAGALSGGQESVADPDCRMAASLWLCGNRQSTIPDRGAAGSRSLTHIARKRKGTTEQIRVGAVRLPGISPL